jgi:hypothetical protein
MAECRQKSTSAGADCGEIEAASTEPVDKAAQQTRRGPGRDGRAHALSPRGQGGPRRLAGMAKQGVEGGRSSQRMCARVSPAAGRSREAGTAGRKKEENKSRGPKAQHCKARAGKPGWRPMRRPQSRTVPWRPQPMWKSRSTRDDAERAGTYRAKRTQATRWRARDAGELVEGTADMRGWSGQGRGAPSAGSGGGQRDPAPSSSES